MYVLTHNADRETMVVGVYSSIDFATSAMNAIREEWGGEPLEFVAVTDVCWSAWEGDETFTLVKAELNQNVLGTDED